MTAVVLAACFGLGVLLIFDALTRPAAPRPPRPRSARRARYGLDRLAGRLGWGGTAAIVAFALAVVLTRWIALALVAAALGAAGPGMIERAQRHRAQIVRREALAQVAGRIRDALRGASGLPEAIALAADTAPAALATELRLLKDNVNRLGVSEGLELMRQATDDPMLSHFCVLLERAYRSGSRRVGTLLDVVAEGAALQARTEREIRSRQTATRAEAGIVGALPVLLLLAVRATNPAFLSAYGSAQGQLVMAIGFGMIGTGFYLATRTGRGRR
jgi:tight adherence protein B